MSSFKKVLAKLSERGRTDFLESMVFGDGTLINIKTKGLGAVVKGNELVALMQDTGCTTTGYACDPFVAGQCFKEKDSACDAAACKGNKSSVVTLGGLLEGVPPKVRNQFLNSLDFVDGKLIKAKSDALKGHVAPDKIEQLPRVAGR